MLERVLLLAAGGLVLFSAIIIVRTWARLRTKRLMTVPGSELLDQLGAPRDGRQTLVTFSTPSCAACHTAQAPAVNVVEQRLGTQHLRVLHIDASSQPALATAFGIRTVPSTVVLDPSGRVTAVNHGFAPSQQLVKQLQHA
jgi:thiol-disulfide isomerase/thioredoxin